MEKFLNDYPAGFASFKKVLVTSDHHFGHKNILRFEPIRATIMENSGWLGNHDDFMIDDWNKNVGPDDLVIHLGDLAFKGLDEFIYKLNGTILLVLGNHDRKPQTYLRFPDLYVVESYWNLDAPAASRYHVFGTDKLFSGFEKNNIVFTHYPLYSIDAYDLRNPHITERITVLQKLSGIPGTKKLNIHGHRHSREAVNLYSSNVCIDNTGFKWNDITELVVP